MRSYKCYFYYLSNNNQLYKSNNEACWGNIELNSSEMFGNRNAYLPDTTKFADKKSFDQNYIYIDEYKEDLVTDKDRKRVISLLNNITECKFVKIEGKTYIKYKLFDNYDANLILLNFIRMFWYHPGYFDIVNYYKDIHTKRSKGQDSLEFLLKCVRDNVTEVKNNPNGYDSYGDHSIIHRNIILKKSEDLYNFKGNSTKKFLTNNY